MFVDFFLKRPVFASVCSLLLVLAGAASIPFLPIARYPAIIPPQVSVEAYYLGASAEVVESTVTIPLEQQLNGLPGLKVMSSTSSNDGSSSINLTFDRERNLDLAAVDVQDRVFHTLGRLPSDVRQNGVTVHKVASGATVLDLALVADEGKYSPLFVSNYADLYIRPALKRIPGVGDIHLFGERRYAMRIWLDPNRLSARGLTPREVMEALQSQNVQVASGQVGQPPTSDQQTYQMTVRTVGRLATPAAFNDLGIRTTPDGTMIRLRDVGNAELGAEDYRTNLHYNGHEAIGIDIQQRPDANALDIKQAVMATMKDLAPFFPPGLTYEVPFDGTQAVEASLYKVLSALLEAIVLVILVMFLFLHSWRSTLIPTLTIPICLIGTFAFLKGVGFSINTLSLFGLTLATGLVVDDAIVVIENVERFVREKHLSPWEATKAAMQEVFGAVIATSLVLVAVFLPVTFFPGTTGQIYKQFAVTLSFSIFLSALVALTLTPMLTARLLSQTHTSEARWALWVEACLERLRQTYARSLVSFLRCRRAGILGFLLLLCFTGWLVQKVPRSFVPDEDVGYLIVQLKTPAGSSLAYTTQVMEEVENRLRTIPEIVGIFAESGYPAANRAGLYPNLLPLSQRPRKEQSMEAILQKARALLEEMPNVQATVFSPSAIPGLGSFGGFQFALQDKMLNSNAMLDRVTKEMLARGKKVPALTALHSSFAIDEPMLRVEVDRDKAQQLHVPLGEVFSTLGILLGSEYVNDFDYLGRSYRVYAQAHADFRSQEQDISQFQVRSQTGEMIPLRSLIRIEHITGPPILERYNMFRTANISGSAAPGYSSGQALEAMSRLAKEVLPPGMGFEWAGISREELEAGSKSVLLFVLGILFVYLVLAAQYESFVLPLTVLFAVPLAVCGALLAQWARGLQNDIFCQVGLVMLVGLASKNAILIVEFANQIRKQGGPLHDAVVQAATLRLRPILMTSLAFLLGVLPLVFAQGEGKAARHSIGTTVFGGMLLSTVLTLYVIPLLYLAVESLRTKRSSL